MGLTSIWQWVIILAVILILFARPGKISGIMGDFGKGLKSFKEGIKPDDNKDDEVIEDAAEADDMSTLKKAETTKAEKKTTAKKTAKQAASKGDDMPDQDD